MFPSKPAAEAPGAFAFDSEAASLGGCEESEPVRTASQPTAADFVPSHAAEIPVLSSIRRRQQQDWKKTMFGLLLVGIAGLAIASLSLVFRSNDQQSGEAGGPSGVAEGAAQKARPEEAVAKPGDKPRRESSKTVDDLAAKPAAAEKWVDASQSPAVFGDVSVGIALVAKAPSRAGKTDEGRLLIGVEVRNLSATRKVDYIGWIRDAVARSATLTDNFGNVYRPVPVGHVSVSGPRPPMSIYPGKSGREVLAFEPPVAKAALLRLELSAVAFGKDDVVRLTIPAKMITQRADWIGPEGAKPPAPGEAAKKSAKKPPAARPGTPEGDFGIRDGDAPP